MKRPESLSPFNIRSIMTKLISTEELQEKLNKHEPVFILDVRPKDQREEWKIEGSTHVDAYTQLKAGDHTALDLVEVPRNATVVTVCAAGRTSVLASELLQKKGIEAYSLAGGMKAWNYAWNTAELDFGKGKIVQVRRTAKGVLSYVVGSSSEAIVIDAALDPDVYQRIARENGWSIKYVMDTHVHADYVSRTRELASATKARHLMIGLAKVAFEFDPISDEQSVKFGDTEMRFLHTPGHTWESTTFKLGDVALFTGDTLFIDGIGRPDLKADQPEAIEKTKALYHSLKRLLTYNSQAMVLPAHTSSAIGFDNRISGETIANIKSKLDVFRLSESDFVAYALAKIPPTPPNYVAIAEINRKGSYEGTVLADLEAGGNHCAIA
jgi:glyoxylase-like metal-dependent hydrolase (beta-lactamase superfamily II)/rhodanese-related sulfurtransferase